MRIALGSKVRDKITGYEGIATARITYLSGCDRIGIQAKIGKDGKVPESHFVDEPMLEVLAGPTSEAKPMAGLGAG